MATTKGQVNEFDTDFNQFKQTTGSYIVLQAANSESRIEHYDEYPHTEHSIGSSLVELNSVRVANPDE